jgi:hypothetical protein
MGGGERLRECVSQRSQKNRFDTGETERFECHGVIKNRYEQWITKIQSHRVSWSTKSERWSSVRVGPVPRNTRSGQAERPISITQNQSLPTRLTVGCLAAWGSVDLLQDRSTSSNGTVNVEPNPRFL